MGKLSLENVEFLPTVISNSSLELYGVAHFFVAVNSYKHPAIRIANFYSCLFC